MPKHLTKEQRELIFQKLTTEQREALAENRRYVVQSAFLNAGFAEETDWDYYGYRLGAHYHEEGCPKSAKLYCECGRELKHQYLVKSRSTGEIKKLGSKHLEDHLGVPAAVAKRVMAGIQNIDIGLDEILLRVARGDSFPNKLYALFTEYDLKARFSNLQKKRIRLFSTVNLPIYPDEEALMSREVNEYQRAVQRRRELETAKTEEAAKSTESATVEPQPRIEPHSEPSQPKRSTPNFEDWQKTRKRNPHAELDDFWKKKNRELKKYENSGFSSGNRRYPNRKKLYEIPDLKKVEAKVEAYSAGEMLGKDELLKMIDLYMPAKVRQAGSTTEEILAGMMAELAGKGKVAVVGENYYRIED